jgi:hypothetical protein
MRGMAPSTIIMCLITSAQYQTKPNPPRLPVKQLEMKLQLKITVSLATMLVQFIDYPFPRNILFYNSFTALCLARPGLCCQRGYVLTSRLPYLNAPPPSSLWLCQSVPDGPPLQSPLVRRTAPPRVYVEENSQEELQPAWDDGNLTNPTPPLRPLSPDRNIQQLPSSSGKVAYVIFGDHETDGVFNNWCGS